MSLKRTPFFPFHKAAGARLIDFGGWEMPVQFSGLIHEHQAVRQGVGIFDVSHMGEVWIRGDQALDVVQILVSNDAAALQDGQAFYTVMCNERGGIVDDLIVYRFSAREFLVCVNAANREKDFRWMYDHNPLPGEVRVEDESDDWAQVAIQGRHAPATLQALTDLDLAALAPFRLARCTVAGVPGCIVARTGYTGEDGFEVFLPAHAAEIMWPAIMKAGEPHGIVPVGLGARDTLRLEAKYCLYGNDITDDTTPLEAGLGWVVKLEKGVDFIGAAALRAQKEAGVPRRLVCLVVEERIARPHHPILSEGEKVGEITSGTRSPSLDANIALGYVPSRLAKPGTNVQVDVRGRIAEARVVKPPFYSRPY